MASTRSGYTSTIFVIDVSPSMGKTRIVEQGFGGQKTTKEMTNLEYGLEYVKAKVGAVILAGLKTVHVSIVLYGSDETDNGLSGRVAGYDHIWEYLGPHAPKPSTLIKIDAIPSFLSKKTAVDKGDVHSALILAVDLLSRTVGTKKWTRKVALVTDGETETDWEGLDNTKKKMDQDGVALTVVGLDFDDADMDIQFPDKSEAKTDNELMLRRLCETLSAPSVYGSAEAAVPDAMAPQLKAIQTRADAYTLTLGHPEVDPVRLEELGYDPKHTLRIPVQLRKCTSSVRPMGSKMMGKAGVREEREKERKFLDQLVKAKAGKGKGQDDDLMIVDDDEADGDDDHDLGPTGAGYLNRDSIYYYTNAETSNGSGGQGKKRKRVEGDEEGEDEVEEEEAPRRQAQKEDLIKAYKYGATLVPVDDMDEEELRMKFSQCLEIIGFVKTSDIPRYHIFNDVSYLHANQDQAKAQLLFSALIHAMVETGRSALCRFVSKYKAAEPRLVVLIPQIVAGAQFCWQIQVPFAEDLRDYAFPALNFVKTRSGKILTEHPNIATDAMKSKMEELVDEMDLADPEDPEGASWLNIEEDAYSPSVHNVKNAVLYRLTHPEDKELPPVHPDLTKYLEPPQFVKERSEATLEELKKLLDVKKVPPKIKHTRRKGGPKDFENESQTIDIDSILGANYEPLKASGSGSGAMDLDSPSVPPKAGGSGASQKEKVALHENGAAKNSSQTKPLVGDGSEGGSETEDEEEDESPKKSARKAGEPLVGLQDPVGDFRRAIEDSGVGSDLVGEAVSSMLTAVQEIVETSFSRSQFPKASKCLKEVREVASKQDETDTYNTFLRSFKSTLHSKGFKNKEFWTIIKDERLGLITLEESASEEGVSQKEADEFYED